MGVLGTGDHHPFPPIVEATNRLRFALTLSILLHVEFSYTLKSTLFSEERPRTSSEGLIPLTTHSRTLQPP